MKTFLITYDLIGIETYVDYKILHNRIKKLFDNWARPVRSVWVVKSNLDVAQIRDLISVGIDLNDKVFVVETTKNMAWKNISNEVAEWLKSHI